MELHLVKMKNDTFPTASSGRQTREYSCNSILIETDTHTCSQLKKETQHLIIIITIIILDDWLIDQAWETYWAGTFYYNYYYTINIILSTFSSIKDNFRLFFCHKKIKLLS